MICRVFLPAIDDAIADVKRMRALAIRLALALHLDDLPVFADAERRIERRHAQKIPRLMFDGENQIRDAAQSRPSLSDNIPG